MVLAESDSSKRSGNCERNSKPVVVGVGINATDTVIRLPRFPTLDSKVEVASAEVKAGGQVASAMVACRRWGLEARYVGKIGDDPAGTISSGRKCSAKASRPTGSRRRIA